MAFLFKSKKNQQDRAAHGRDGPPSSGSSGSPGATARVVRDEKAARSTPTGSLNSLDEGSPIQDVDKYAVRRAPEPAQQPPPQQQREHPQQQQLPPQQPPPQSDLPLRNAPQSNPNASLFPWSQRRLNYTSAIPSPFPRYGAAVNGVSSKEGDIYVMGGLINSSTVKGDLWMIEAGGSMSCYPLPTTAEGPGPRVGHASLLVGNAFIVYGGDTKIDEADVLDETLYLLNTSTRQWSRALPSGTRPSGRYGHSLNIIGSKIFIFGGQIEGYFMNDLAAFDLNQLQLPTNRWEILVENNENNVSPKGKIPPARTNHTVITYNDKMYLFGGTNGFQWFNDVWCFDPATIQWTQLDCIGYIPVPREGHAAALVDDVMYIFGGRTEEGADLGDLAAFRISSRRWYTFQNMGPTPSARSGHSMTTVGKSVVVVGGEPSSATTQVNDLSIVYVLDTTKIRYPNDAQIQSNTQKMQQQRRPSGSEDVAGGQRALPPRDGSNGPGQRRPQDAASAARPMSPPKGPNGAQVDGPPGGSKLPRMAPPPQGPPPQGQPPRPNVNTANGRVRNASIERIERDATGSGSSSPNLRNQSPILRDVIKEEAVVAATNGRRTPQGPQGPPGPPARKPENPPPTAMEATKNRATRQTRGQGSVDSTTEPNQKIMANRPASPPPPTRQNSNPLNRRSSGRNSQTVVLLKELDAARNRNAWYASELELARKSGYTPSAAMSPTLESRAESFDDEDRPLIEALLAMRQELTNVQNSVDKQAIIAAKQIAEAERQRDAAVQEALYAKAKMAAHTGSTSSTPQMDNDRDESFRTVETNRKLAAALNLQKDLHNTLERTNADLAAEKRARQLADDTATAAQKRMSDLEMYKQQASLELESLRAELHMVQRESRDHATTGAEAAAALDALRVEHSELRSRFDNSDMADQDSGADLDSLRAAVAASEDMRTHLESKLEEERALRETIEARLTKLKAEHEAQTAELVAVSQRLRDAEELAEKHANEAKTHRLAVISGLDKISQNGVKSKQVDADRITALQNQITAANNLVKKYQQEADSASDKLRSAEERIAGLEAYQEQSSREGVTIRRQLQAALKDTQTLQAMNSDLKHQLANQQLETNAMTVQHNTLKDILTERGISPTGLARVRGINSRNDSPAGGDLEQQLIEARAANDELRQNFDLQVQQNEATYRERITQLESDYQSAVHYVKGTEKMLKRMKEELSKYKSDNARLKNENLELEEKAMNAEASGASAPADWDSQRSLLEKKIETLQEQVRSSSAELETQMAVVRQELQAAKLERDHATQASGDATQRLAMMEKGLEQMQQENALLEKRAQDAEHKVGMLLDQVENSVDHYRRQSRQAPSVGSDATATAIPSMNPVGHRRQESSEAGSMYGGLGDARNSTALDNLADELDQLRTKWEATNENYRLSTAFDFDGANTINTTTNNNNKKGDENVGVGLGLSESLADWRKRLDSDDHDGQSARRI